MVIVIDKISNTVTNTARLGLLGFYLDVDHRYCLVDVDQWLYLLIKGI